MPTHQPGSININQDLVSPVKVRFQVPTLIIDKLISEHHTIDLKKLEIHSQDRFSKERLKSVKNEQLRELRLHNLRIIRFHSKPRYNLGFLSIKNSSSLNFRTILLSLKIDNATLEHSRINTDIQSLNTNKFKLKSRKTNSKVQTRLAKTDKKSTVSSENQTK